MQAKIANTYAACAACGSQAELGDGLCVDCWDSGRKARGFGVVRKLATRPQAVNRENISSVQADIVLYGLAIRPMFRGKHSSQFSFYFCSTKDHQIYMMEYFERGSEVRPFELTANKLLAFVEGK